MPTRRVVLIAQITILMQFHSKYPLMEFVASTRKPLVLAQSLDNAVTKVFAHQMQLNAMQVPGVNICMVTVQLFNNLRPRLLLLLRLLPHLPLQHNLQKMVHVAKGQLQHAPGHLLVHAALNMDGVVQHRVTVAMDVKLVMETVVLYLLPHPLTRQN